MNAADHLLGTAALARFGSRTALLCSGEAIDFAALAAMVQRAAAGWTSLGAARGERVLILLRDTPEFAAAWLGALYAGTVAIAVNGRLSVEDQRFMFEDSAARLFLTEAESAASVAAFAGERCVPLSQWQHVTQSVTPLRQPAPVRP